MVLFKNLAGKKDILKSVGIYTGLNFLSKSISFLLLFIYTNPKFISLSDNGLLNLFSSAILFLMPFVAMGITQSTAAEFFKLDGKTFNNFFTTNLIIPFSSFLLSIIFLYLFRNQLASNYGFPHYFIILIPVVAILTYFNEQLIGLLRDIGDIKKFAATSIAKLVIEFGLSVLLVVAFSMSYKGRLVGITLSYAILGIYAFFYFRKMGYLSGSIKKEFIKSELIYAIPIILMQSSIFALNSSDKFFLANFTNNSEVAIYGVACSFCSIIYVLSSSYVTYLVPNVYKNLSGEQVNYPAIKSELKMYLIVMAVITIGLMLCIPIVYKLFINSKYHGGLKYYYFIAIAYFFWTITSFLISFLLYYKEKRKLVMFSVASLVSTVICIYIFGKYYGSMGVAIGVFFSYAINLLLMCYFVKGYLRKIF